MLKCEGYMMFRGLMKIAPPNPKFPEEKVRGVWLYKPEYECWYCNGRSYDASICEVEEDETQ